MGVLKPINKHPQKTKKKNAISKRKVYKPQPQVLKIWYFFDYKVSLNGLPMGNFVNKPSFELFGCSLTHGCLVMSDSILPYWRAQEAECIIP
jgi:hypothetical protein